MEDSFTKIKILGMEYKISCSPEEKDQVKEAAKFFNSKLKEIRENTKLEEGKAAIIVGLNITNDYLKNLSLSKKASTTNPELKRLSLDIEKHIKTISKLDS